MKKTIFQLFLLLLANSFLYSQTIDVKIYHGASGSTQFYYKNDKEKIIRTIGDPVRIKILNPNTLYYTYEFKVEEIEIKEETPDVSALVGLLKGFFSSAAAVTSSAAEKMAASTKAVSSINLDLTKYREALNELQTDINSAQNFIKNSDDPELGIKYAQDEIRKLSSAAGHINDASLQDYLNSLVDGSGDNAASDNKFIKDLLKGNNASIVNTINELKKRINEAKRMILFSETVGEKQKKIKLIIKKKPNITDPQNRDEIEQEFVLVQPEYKRNNLEIIPVANLTYAPNTYTFSVKNGLVTKESTDGWKFRAGAMLVYYPVKFGPYKEGALGVGLGFNIPKNKSILENFYVGTNVSFKNIFRIGIGWGFSEYPSSLKSDIMEGAPLPKDISKVEDLILYDKRSSFFITFSISGIPLL